MGSESIIIMKSEYVRMCALLLQNTSLASTQIKTFLHQRDSTRSVPLFNTICMHSVIPDSVLLQLAALLCGINSMRRTDQEKQNICEESNSNIAMRSTMR